MSPFEVIAEQLGLEHRGAIAVLHAACRELVLVMTGPGPIQEEAAQRLLAELTTPFGVRERVAPESMPLGEAPLQGDSTACRAARGALVLIHDGPWRELVLPGLNAIAFAVSATPVRGPGREASCRDCAWCLELQTGDWSCEKAEALVDPSQPVCGAEEGRFGAEACADCGACCRQAYGNVRVEPEDPTPREWVQRVDGSEVIPRPEGSCPYLSSPPYRCAIYPLRPSACSAYDVGSVACLGARRRAGVRRLPVRVA